MVAFTGGTAFNGIVNELMELTSRVTHVLPVSDDGGSTAEIVRVLGGGAAGVQFLGFKVQSSKFRVQGSGFRVQGSGFKVQGLRSRV